jgi:hypothetical protein
MKLERAVLTAIPESATERDYERAASELEESLAALPGALAVYRYGSTTAPGISDIDRLAVIENGRSVPDLWPTLSEQTRRLAMHTPVLVDAQTLRDHRWFAEAGNLTHVWGERFDVRQRPFPDYSEPLLAGEALVVTALRLAKLAVTRRVKIRPLLCELGNFRLDLDLARVDRSESPLSWKLADDVERIRNEWWNVDDANRRDRVRNLLAFAPDAVDDAMRSLATRVRVRERPAPLRLGGAWRNVTLTPGNRVRENSHVASRVIGYSRRLGEARWTWSGQLVALPEGLMALLTGPPPGKYEEFRYERDKVVCRYVDFLASCPGYSAVGLAALFLPGRLGHRPTRRYC